MKLYLIQHNNDDGEDLNLFVKAESTLSAIALWVKHYEIDGEDGEDFTPDRVFVVPTGGMEAEGERALKWFEDIRQVGGRLEG